jgi:hypothetical protein
MVRCFLWSGLLVEALMKASTIVGVEQGHRIVQGHVSHVLAVQNLFSRNRGRSPNANRIKRLTPDAVSKLLLDHEACAQVSWQPQYRHLLTTNGIGKIPGLTILLETGPVQRFAGSATTPPTAAVSVASASPTASAMVGATPRAAQGSAPAATQGSPPRVSSACSHSVRYAAAKAASS